MRLSWKVLLTGSFFNAAWILKEHGAYEKWCFQKKFILHHSVKQKRFSTRFPVIRFSDWLRYSDLAVILGSDLTKFYKNIKHNSYLIKDYMIATKAQSIFKTY